MKCRYKIFKALVRRDPAEKQNRPFTISDAQSLLCLARGKTRVRSKIVDPERDDSDPGLLRAKVLHEFELRLFCVNEDMVGEPILDLQREPIDERISRIPPACIHIVRREDDPLPQELVVKHKQRSVQGLKLV